MSNDSYSPKRNFRKSTPLKARIPRQNGKNRNALRNSGVRPQVRSSWDPLAEWYDGWMGQDGSRHHQLVLPTVMELLDVQPHEKVIDLGCGQGVLAEPISKAGGEFTGIDVSDRLVNIAKQRHGSHGEFFVGNVTKLSQMSDLKPESFDKAVFLLSIQDIDPLLRAFQSASWILKPGGTLVILMTHPAFRIPRQSGWGFDEKRKLRYRRVDSYLTPNTIPLKPYPGETGVSVSYHRPLQEYFKALREAGFIVNDLRELSTADWLNAQTVRAEARAVKEIPLFLALQCVRR